MTEPTPGPEAERDPLEILADEFLDRLRRGESPTVEEYASAHPDLAEAIRELFPTVSAVERMKARGERSTDGRASLGPVRLERLGDFRIIREIGRGGMGIVYEAEQESLGRRVAIKVLPRQMLLEPNDLARFEREARIAANLHHTNIVQVYGVGEQEGFHYYVMQLVRGAPLDRVIDRLKAITQAAAPGDDLADQLCERLLGPGRRVGPEYFRNVARLGMQAANALEYGHTQGTLHRDIKPANLILDEDGVVWVTDFGLARTSGADGVSEPGDVAGTLRYMPPERFDGKVDVQGDVYGLGLTLYELLTLRPAYEDTDKSALIRRITHEPLGRPALVNPRIPRDLETVVLKAVAHEPRQRYASAGELAADLGRFVDDQPVLARRIGPVERLWRWCRRNRAVAALSAASLLLLVAVAVTATVGYVRTRSALASEARERERAESVAELAREAIDRVFDRLGPSRPFSATSLTLTDDCNTSVEIPHPAVVSKEAAALLEEMLPFYDRLAQQAGSNPVLRARAADATRRLGDIRQRLGQYDQAAATYLKAVESYKSLALDKTKGDEFLVLAASTLNELGRTYRLERKSAQAADAHQQVLNVLGAADGASGASAAARFEIAKACYYLGSRMNLDPALRPPPGPGRDDLKGDGPGPRPGPPPSPDAGFAVPADAPPVGGPPPSPRQEFRRRYLDRAVGLLDVLIKEDAANPNYQHLLALCYREQAFGPGDSAVRDGVDRAIRILEALVKKCPDEPQYRFDLSETCALPASRGPGPDLEDPASAEARTKRALELSQQLVAQYPGVPEYASGQARIYFGLGEVLRRARRFGEAEQAAQKAADIQAGLVGEFPDVVTYRVLLTAYHGSLAEMLLRRGSIAEAMALTEANIAEGNHLLAAHPDIWYVHAFLADSNRILASILRASGKPDLADAADRESARHRDALNAARRPLEQP